MRSGKFVVFEGLDGSGITTQAMLLREYLENKGWTPFLTKEPTDGPVGSILRMILARRITVPASEPQEADRVPFDSHALTLLFAADRLDHLFVDVIPKLENGIMVISDRYYLSSFAYQSLDVDMDWILQANSRCIKPDLTVFLDVPAVICKKRMERQRWHVELFEELPKLEKIRQNYLLAIDRLRKDRAERIEIIDGNRPIEQVHRDIAKHFVSLGKIRDKDRDQPTLGFVK